MYVWLYLWMCNRCFANVHLGWSKFSQKCNQLCAMCYEHAYVQRKLLNDCLIYDDYTRYSMNSMHDILYGNKQQYSHNVTTPTISFLIKKKLNHNETSFVVSSRKQLSHAISFYNYQKRVVIATDMIIICMILFHNSKLTILFSFVKMRWQKMFSFISLEAKQTKKR